MVRDNFPKPSHCHDSLSDSPAAAPDLDRGEDEEFGERYLLTLTLFSQESESVVLHKANLVLDGESPIEWLEREGWRSEFGPKVDAVIIENVFTDQS